MCPLILLLFCATWGHVHSLLIARKSVVGCSSLEESPPLTLVWAWSGGVGIDDLSKALKTTKSSRPGQHARLLCGNSDCLAAGEKLAADGWCINAERLDVQGLAAGTPAEEWCRHHVLAKVLAGPRYEQHLQVVVQLVALWHYGGTVAHPGVSLPPDAESSEAWLATNDDGKAITLEHGLLALSAGESKSKFAEKLLHAIIATYPQLTGLDESYDYDRRHWPLTIDWDNVVTQGTSAWTKGNRTRVDARTIALPLQLPTRNAIFSFMQRQRHLHDQRYLENEMQQLAGLQFLPHVDHFVESDDMYTTWGEQGLDARNLNDTMLLFVKAQFDSAAAVCPPPSNIDPVLLALHFTGLKGSDASQNKLISDETISFLNSHWPVVTSDPPTHDMLVNSGVRSVYGVDMAFTLSPICDRKALAEAGKLNKTFVIDVDPEVLEKVAPADVVEAATIGTHEVDPLSPIIDHELARYAAAYGQLVKYACEAKLLITKQIHTAISAAAMGTPVLLVKDAGRMEEPGGLEDFVHTATVAEGAPASFDWSDPPSNPERDRREEMTTRMRDIVSCQEPRLVDAAMMFSALPLHASALVADGAACVEPVRPDAIHITAALDANLLSYGNGVSIASWAHSLGASNNDSTLVLYLLSDGLTQAQQCILRARVRRYLSSTSKVYTIPVEKMLDDLARNYGEDRNGISRVTMARLKMPELLPCVKKSLWIDLDTLVLKSLVPLFAKEIDAQCGIAAAESSIAYMQAEYRGPDREDVVKTWNDNHYPSLNAGVLSIDLDRIRAQKPDYDNMMDKVAVENGNDDQVSLNAFCKGQHTQLDMTWNVPGDRDVLEAPSTWAILHFKGHTKPWHQGWKFHNNASEAAWRQYATTLFGEWGSHDALPRT